MVKRTRHSLTLVYVHLVWTTKHRVAVLDEQLLGKLCTLAKESGKNQGVEVIVCGGYEDHMHVFVRYRPDQKISDISRKLKASLSYWLRREGELPDFEWQEGYGAFSVSHNDTNRIINYIRKQKEHHQEGSTNEHLEPADAGPNDPESAGV